MIIVLLLLAIAGIFLGDQWLKNRVEKMSREKLDKSMFGGLILVRRHHNKGAMLNVGTGRRSLVALISLILTIGASIWFVFSFGKGCNRILQAGLTLLLGGAFSNTYDRLFRKYVVDYFSFDTKAMGLKNIVFNLADLCIIIGALLSAIGAGR